MSQRILMIENDITSAMTMTVALRREGYDVIMSQTGSEGLNQAVKAKPDLVILNVMLPGLDGFQVCRYLRSERATADLPVIMFAATHRLADQRAAFTVGADDYMVQPDNMVELVTRVRSMLLFSRYGLS